MKCSVCGCEVPTEAKFCAKCGKKITKSKKYVYIGILIAVALGFWTYNLSIKNLKEKRADHSVIQEVKENELESINESKVDGEEIKKSFTTGRELVEVETTYGTYDMFYYNFSPAEFSIGASDEDWCYSIDIPICVLQNGDCEEEFSASTNTYWFDGTKACPAPTASIHIMPIPAHGQRNDLLDAMYIDTRDKHYEYIVHMKEAYEDIGSDFWAITLITVGEEEYWFDITKEFGEMIQVIDV